MIKYSLFLATSIGLTPPCCLLFLLSRVSAAVSSLPHVNSGMYRRHIEGLKFGFFSNPQCINTKDKQKKQRKCSMCKVAGAIYMLLQ